MLFKKKTDQNPKLNEEKKDLQNPENKVITNPQAVGASKKIKKPKPIWNNKYKLIDVQFPQPIENPKFKKKYKLNITFKNDEDKIRKKTIRFGKKDDPDFVDGADIVKKSRLSSKLGNTHNMFHGNFWRLHLLNGESKNLKENYLNLISKI